MLSLHLRERLTQTVNVLDKKRTILHGGGGGLNSWRAISFSSQLRENITKQQTIRYSGLDDPGFESR